MSKSEIYLAAHGAILAQQQKIQVIENEPKPFSESDYFVFDMPHKHALSKPKKPNKGIKIGSYSSKRTKI